MQEPARVHVFTLHDTGAAPRQHFRVTVRGRERTIGWSEGTTAEEIAARIQVILRWAELQERQPCAAGG